MFSPYQGVIRIEADDEVEEYGVDLAEHLAARDEEIRLALADERAARAVGRIWYTRWAWMLIAFGAAVAALAWTWGGIWLGYIG